MPNQRSFRSTCELALALLIAAAFSDLFSKAAWQRAGRAVKALFGRLKAGEQVSDEVYEARMNCCRACPIFWNHLGGTCGSPLKRRDSESGCFCHMPTKCREKYAECWLDAELGPSDIYGWGAIPVAAQPVVS